MKEFLLLIRTEGDVWTSLSPGQLQEHIEKGTSYIGNLIKEGKLKSAAPLDKGSRIVTDTDGVIKDGPFNEAKEVIAGYFHIVARDVREAGGNSQGKPDFHGYPHKDRGAPAEGRWRLKNNQEIFILKVPAGGTFLSLGQILSISHKLLP